MRLDSGEYRDYLRSKQWLQIRCHMIWIARHQCEACGVLRPGHRLQIHHLTYERLGHERFEDLVVLCGDCHLAVERGYNDPTDPEFIERVRELRKSRGLNLHRYVRRRRVSPFWAGLYGWVESTWGVDYDDLSEYRQERAVREFKRYIGYRGGDA